MVACVQGTPREKYLGAAVSVLVGILSTGLLMGSQSMGATTETSVVLANLVGNFLGYTGDILIAKQCFDAWNGTEYVPVKYDQWDVRNRFVWYLKSMASKSFLRFVLTVTIDLIVSLAIIDMVIQVLDDLNIKFRFRDAIIAGGVSIITFQVFVNEIRFNYAYNRSSNFTHDLIVFMWASLLIVIYVMLRKLNVFESKHFVKPAIQFG